MSDAASQHAFDRLGPPRGSTRAYAVTTSPKAIDLSVDFPAVASDATQAGAFFANGCYWTISAFSADVYYVLQTTSSVAGADAIAPAALDATTPAQQCMRLAAGQSTEIRPRAGEQWLQVATASGTGEVRLHPSSGTKFGSVR